jgi:hypothetical protein
MMFMKKKGFESRESFQRCEDPSDLFYLIRHPTSNVAAKAVPPPDMTPKVDPLIKEFEEKLEHGELKGASFGKFVALVLGFPPYFIFYRFPKWLFGTLIPLLFNFLFYPFSQLKGKWQRVARASKERCTAFFLKFNRTKKIERPKKAPWSLDLWVKKKLMAVWNPVKNALIQPVLIPFRAISTGYRHLADVITYIRNKIRSFFSLIFESCSKRMQMIKTAFFRVFVDPIVNFIQPKVKLFSSLFRVLKNKIKSFCLEIYEWMTAPRRKFKGLIDSLTKKMNQIRVKVKRWIKLSRDWYQEQKTAFIAALKGGPDYAIRCISKLLTFIEKKSVYVQQQTLALIKAKWKTHTSKVKVTPKKKSKSQWKLMTARLWRIYLLFRVRIRKQTRPLTRLIGNHLKRLGQLLKPLLRPVWLIKGIQMISQPLVRVCDKGIYGARWCRAWMVVLSRYGWTVIQSTSEQIHLPLEKKVS